MTNIMQSRHSGERRQGAETDAFLRRLDNGKVVPELVPELAAETIAAARSYRSGGLDRFIAKARRWVTSRLAVKAGLYR